MTRRAFLFFATLILLGGAFLRLAELHRYPPGLHYDEAADMLLSRDIAWYGFRPFPVVAAYSGREALFYYVAAPLVRILSAEPHEPTVLSTRLTSAFLGILTIAATLALGRAMFRGHRRAAWIALLAAAWLAVNGPQVWLTRQGFRTSPQPLLEALALWMMFVALRRGRRWILPAILGGAFAGLALYVYMAARIFPIWMAFALLLSLATQRRAFVSRLRRVAVILLTMTVTALPIVLFYVQHPDVLLDRLAQVGPSGGTLTLLQSVQAHLEMFFLKGDPLLRYNLYPGRPWFDPVTGVLTLLGLAAALALFVRRGDPLLRVAGAWVLLAPLLIAPSVIAVGGLPPSHMRSVAMVPLIFFAPALGAMWLAERVSRERQPSPPGPLSPEPPQRGPRFAVEGERKYGRTSPPGPLSARGEGESRGGGRAISPLPLAGEGLGVRAVPPQNASVSLKPLSLRERGWGEGIGLAVVFSFIVFLGLNTRSDYTAWAARADLFYDSDGDMQAAAQWLEQNAAPDDLIYVYSRFYEHPTLLAYDVDHGQVRWVMQDHLFLPPLGRSALYIVPHSINDRWPIETLLAEPLPGAGEIPSEELPRGPDGAPAFWAYRVPAQREAPPAPAAPPGPFAPSKLTLNGWLSEPEISPAENHIRAGQQVEVMARWRVLATPDQPDLFPVVSLHDGQGEPLAPPFYPYIEHSGRWLPGEVLIQRLRLDVPVGNPPGLYALRFLWAARAVPDRPLPWLMGGQYAGFYVERKALTIDRGGPAPVMLPPDAAPVAPGVFVIEPPTLPDRLEQGERFKFALRWYAEAPPGDLGELTLGLYQGEALKVHLYQAPPGRGGYPFAEWGTQEQVIDRYDVPIPSDAPPGRYTLRLDAPGLTRPAFSHAVEIVAAARSYSMPSDFEPLSLLLGPQLPMFWLQGYDMTLIGSDLTLRLAWKSIQSWPDRDYTVFVHVLNPNGTIFSQVDRQPTRPTSRWDLGEVVVETYTLPLPEGPYSIETGLYVQENGKRLTVFDEGWAPLGDAIRFEGLPCPPRTAGDARP